MTDHLQSIIENKVLRLTLSHPEDNNALTLDMVRLLSEALSEADDNHEVEAVLLDAQGKLFCAGIPQEASLSEMHAPYRKLFGTFREMHKPIVVSVQGPAFGAGIALLAAAHVVVAAQGVTFGLTEVRQARFSDLTFGAVARAIGKRRTLELSISGRIFAAQEALQWGLIHAIAPLIELEDRAWGIARELANAEPATIRETMDFARTFES